jgi:hypothetical protein
VCSPHQSIRPVLESALFQLTVIRLRTGVRVIKVEHAAIDQGSGGAKLIRQGLEFIGQKRGQSCECAMQLSSLGKPECRLDISIIQMTDESP